MSTEGKFANTVSLPRIKLPLLLFENFLPTTKFCKFEKFLRHEIISIFLWRDIEDGYSEKLQTQTQIQKFFRPPWNTFSIIFTTDGNFRDDTEREFSCRKWREKASFGWYTITNAKSHQLSAEKLLPPSNLSSTEYFPSQNIVSLGRRKFAIFTFQMFCRRQSFESFVSFVKKNVDVDKLSSWKIVRALKTSYFIQHKSWPSSAENIRSFVRENAASLPLGNIQYFSGVKVSAE